MPGYVKPPRNGFVSGTTEMIPSLSSQVPLTIKGATSQTGNLQEWKDSSGNTLSRISSSGVVYGGGLTNVIPTSVVVGSGTSSVSANGAVNFNGATSVSVNGAFNSIYQNYRLLINFYGSVAGNVFAKFRDNSGDISTGYYGCGIYVNIGGTVGPTGLRNNGTEMYIQTSWTDSNQRNLAHFDLQRSPVGTQGAMIGNVWDNWNGTVATHGYHRNDMTNFNGLTIYPASGNLTGTIRVYGFNNG